MVAGGKTGRLLHLTGVVCLAIALFATTALHAADTGIKSPTATGSPNSQWANAALAYSSGNNYATGASNGDLQDWSTFVLGVPAGAQIDGIEVIVEWSSSDTKNSRIGAELSWDGGTSYTLAGYVDSSSSMTDADVTFGGAANTWGRTWTAAELSDANFRVRLNSEDANPDPRVDWIRARVYYTVTTTSTSSTTTTLTPTTTSTTSTSTTTTSSTTTSSTTSSTTTTSTTTTSTTTSSTTTSTTTTSTTTTSTTTSSTGRRKECAGRDAR